MPDEANKKDEMVVKASEELAEIRHQDVMHVESSIKTSVVAFKRLNVRRGERIEVDLVFKDAGRSIETLELSEYLYHVPQVIAAIETFGGGEITAGALYRELSGHPETPSISILRLSYNSPLEITLAASAMGLVFAIILSGGEIEVSAKRIKARLPPLGLGLVSLMKAFQIGRRESLGDKSSIESATKTKRKKEAN